MIRPTAHQVVAARRSPLRLGIIFEKAHDEEEICAEVGDA